MAGTVQSNEWNLYVDAGKYISVAYEVLVRIRDALFELERDPLSSNDAAGKKFQKIVTSTNGTHVIYVSLLRKHNMVMITGYRYWLRTRCGLIFKNQNANICCSLDTMKRKLKDYVIEVNRICPTTSRIDDVYTVYSWTDRLGQVNKDRVKVIGTYVSKAEALNMARRSVEYIQNVVLRQRLADDAYPIMKSEAATNIPEALEAGNQHIVVQVEHYSVLILYESIQWNSRMQTASHAYHVCVDKLSIRDAMLFCPLPSTQHLLTGATESPSFNVVAKAIRAMHNDPHKRYFIGYLPLEVLLKILSLLFATEHRLDNQRTGLNFLVHETQTCGKAGACNCVAMTRNPVSQGRGNLFSLPTKIIPRGYATSLDIKIAMYDYVDKPYGV